MGFGAPGGLTQAQVDARIGALVPDWYGKVVIHLADFTNAAEVVSGSGTTTRGITQSYVHTGSTLGSKAQVDVPIRMVENNVLDFARTFRVLWVWSMDAPASVAAVHFNLVFGPTPGGTNGRINGKGVGFYIQRNPFNAFGDVHNGTSLTTLDLATTPGGLGVANLFEIRWTPASKAEFYINGVLKGTTTTGLPTGTVGSPQMSHNAHNGSTTTATAAFVHAILVEAERIT